MAKGLLEGYICYLAGPIDEAKDDGVGWRKDFKELVHKKKASLLFLDPTVKFKGLTSEVGKEKENQQLLREQGDWKGLRKMFRKIVRADLRMVDIADILIAKVDKNIHMCGTYNEIVIADIEKKPILLIIEGGKKHCPSWLFGIVHHKFMFDSLEECADYIRKVNEKKVKIDDKWVFLRKGIKQLEAANDAIFRRRKNAGKAGI